ncbi:MAG TPA: lysylphosphatidylglycerol synthase transmembrane domain-containing protein [Gaiellaceae bacterium]|nr:lysylphosphatidylglycerol synthase transmembrane domain-containing protein [Gaiellaceae bacterium]
MAMSPGLGGRANAAVRYLRARPSLLRTLQWTLVVATVALCVWAVRDQWSKAAPLLENAKPGYLALGFAIVAVYYLVFILGWIRMLEAWGINLPYRVALQAEMVSMLAKYLPGGVWTPAARAVALRRSAGVTDTPTVLASILVEAGLSAISGVIVFVVSLAWVRGVNAPLLPLVGFGLLCALGLHPRVFRPLARRLLRPFGAESIEPLPFRLTVTLLLFYCATWLIAGTAVYFMLRSVGTDLGLAAIPFLGGTSAVGAIVAVLAVFAPSGLGAREASMYGLLLAVTSAGPALGVTILNRLAITLVELLLFGAGVVSWRRTRGARATSPS